MLRLPTYWIAILLAFVGTAQAQFDPTQCPGGSTAGMVDARWRPVPPRFEVVTELVSGNTIMELSQAFSANRDAIIMNTNAGEIQSFFNYQTNELFEVISIAGGTVMPFCLRQVLTPASETSVVVPKTLFVKPSILLGYSERNRNTTNWGVRYLNDDQWRGIPTNVFQACFYQNDIRASVVATYHMSDPTQFQGYVGFNQSIILQMNVTVKNATAEERFTYNVFRYSPNPSRWEERQALETPAGLFCPNRTSTMPLPSNIPERVSANTETFVPMGNASSIFSVHSLYDTEFQFTRFDIWLPELPGRYGGAHYTEIHDYAVGLNYRYDYSRHRCDVANITTNGNDAVPDPDNPSLLHMGSPQHLFLMDDVEYQYAGEKPCRDRVYCHVWIAEKSLPDNSVQHREWYWSSTINGEPVVRSSPMKLVLKQYSNGALNGSFELNVFNFRRRPMTIFEVDSTLADCYRALGPANNYNLGVLSFRIVNDKKYPVYQNLNYLRVHIWETLIFTMFVRPTRISHLIVDQDDEDTNDIIVTFTLLDAPPVTGNVEDPIKESSLDTVVTRLSSIIDSNGLAFRARYGTNQVTLRARSGSLNVPHRSSKKVEKTSGPKITGLWIGLILVGLVLGGVGGFFALGKLANK